MTGKNAAEKKAHCKEDALSVAVIKEIIRPEEDGRHETD